MKPKKIIAVAVLLVITFSIFYYIEQNRRTQEMQELKELQEELQRLHYEIERKEAENEKVKERLEDISDDVKRNKEFRQDLEPFAMREMEITAYAPNCPQAVEGECYAGDPNITASGAQVVVGDTVAAGEALPFGTRVYIEGYGWRTVTDRGGAIGNNNLDIAVNSREEARRIGRQQRQVLIREVCEH